MTCTYLKDNLCLREMSLFQFLITAQLWLTLYHENSLLTYSTGSYTAHSEIIIAQLTLLVTDNLHLLLLHWTGLDESLQQLTIADTLIRLALLAWGSAVQTTKCFGIQTFAVFCSSSSVLQFNTSVEGTACKI